MSRSHHGLSIHIILDIFSVSVPVGRLSGADLYTISGVLNFANRVVSDEICSASIQRRKQIHMICKMITFSRSMKIFSVMNPTVCSGYVVSKDILAPRAPEIPSTAASDISATSISKVNAMWSEDRRLCSNTNAACLSWPHAGVPP